MLKNIIIILMIILGISLTGCDSIIPENGDEIPEEPENNIVDYVKVIPTGTVTMDLGKSKKFQVKIYNSDNVELPLDELKVVWEASYQCWACGKKWDLNPNQGSDQTIFTPEAIGRYYIWARYDEGEQDYTIIDVE
jgi:hypothetical protein